MTVYALFICFLRAWNIVGKRDILCGTEEPHVRAMFVFHAEEGPHAAPEDLGEGDHKGAYGRMLELEGDACVWDPAESEDWVCDHGEIVWPDSLVP